MSEPNMTRSGPTRSTASRIFVGIGMPEVSRYTFGLRAATSIAPLM